jgi:hypothetical protein
MSEHGEVDMAARMTAADAQFHWMSAKEDLRHVDAAIGTPESWRAALGAYRATIRNTRPPARYAELHQH